MSQEGDQDRPRGEHEKATPEVTEAKHSDAPVVEETSDGGPPPNRAPEYKQTKPYAYAYLVSQYLIVAVAFGGIVVAVCSLNSLNESVTAANKQAIAAATQAYTGQREFEMSERPWVYVDTALLKPLTYDVNGANITMRFILHNVGHSPATNTQINMVAYAEGAPNHASDPLVEQKKLCDPMRSYPPSAHEGGFTLFPAQISAVEDMTVTISRREISDTQLAQMNRSRLKKPIDFLSPIIVGCIDYRVEFSPTVHHQTGFIFSLLATKPETPNARYVLKSYTDYPLSSLSLDPMMVIYGGGDAD